MSIDVCFQWAVHWHIGYINYFQWMASLSCSSILRWKLAGHGLPPVTAGIRVWLDGVGQAGTYGTAERMNGRTRLHRCGEGVPINNGTRIEGVLVRIGSRRQDTKCVAISWMGGLGRTTKRWGGNTSQTVPKAIEPVGGYIVVCYACPVQFQIPGCLPSCRAMRLLLGH